MPLSSKSLKHDPEVIAKVMIEAKYAHKGRTVAEICEARGVNRDIYYYYAKKLKPNHKHYDPDFVFLYKRFVYEFTKGTETWLCEFQETYECCSDAVRAIAKAIATSEEPLKTEPRLFRQIVEWSKLSVETFVALEDIKQSNILAGIEGVNKEPDFDEEYNLAAARQELEGLAIN